MSNIRKLIIDTTPNVRFIADVIRDHLRHFYGDNEDSEYEYDAYTIMLYTVLFAAGEADTALIDKLTTGIYRSVSGRGVKIWDVYDMLSAIVYDKRFHELRDELVPILRDTLGSSIITKTGFKSGFRTLHLELSDGKIDFQH